MPEQRERVVVVTGASRGIGRAITLDQVGRGRHVVAVGRTEASLADTVAHGGGRITTVLADSAEPDSMGAVGDQVLTRCGRLDAVVACAGVHGAEAPVAKLATAEWTEALTINVVAPAQLIRGCIPHLAANPAGGHILLIGSNASVRSPTGFAAYNATKAALHSLMRTLSRELDKEAIAVNELRPGPTNTSLLGGREDSVAASLLSGIGKAFGREWIKTAEDVAAAAGFLLDLPPTGTTGQTLTLNRYE
ncbi:SDR family NAD(P)-dependent oxidoreductase [Pseudonocardia spinosispora]|uniref:SDR family NAD(P)-dependent oxidoreductase n=1 Tax=Pseudonocardia spinosispora TaxID=103441 RepID=UPI00146F946D|nr:SDR family oxidoreductase [Pseudonocardia spinosispora]